jgi:hypothetical protein
MCPLLVFNSQQFCFLSRKEVEVPENLRAALLGEEIMKHVNSDQEEGGKPKRLLTTLLSTRASEIADMDEDALVTEIRTTYQKLMGERSTQYQCRLIDGSYTVTRVVENDVELPSILETVSSGPSQRIHKVKTKRDLRAPLSILKLLPHLAL